jgi:peptidoglycan/LPS O-acetylase OafA/YrhL
MLRGFAALYVFAGHFLLARVLVKEGGSGFLFRFGQEAVMLFFIISGFVVFFATSNHSNNSFSAYFIRRAKRIFPIFYLALAFSLLTTLLRCPLGEFTLSIRELLGNIFMLQDFNGGKPGVWIAPFGGNLALWSLSYEWWFYMMFFPIYRFVPAKRQIHLVASLSLLGYIAYTLVPNQPSLFLMYFILWWSGAEVARSYLNRVPLSISSQGRTILYLIGFVILESIPVISAVIRHQPLLFGVHPVLELRHFSACLIFLTAGLAWAHFRWLGFRQIFGVFSFIAPISYALYVFHFPLAVSASYLSGIGSPTLQLIGYIAITLLAAYLAEIPFQSWINRTFKPATKK